MRTAIAAIACALLVGCGQGGERVAGGNSSEVPNALNGMVVDAQGRPVAGASVRAMPSAAWSDSGGSTVDSTRTDSLGLWFLAVPPGDWSVVAQAAGGMSLRQSSPDGHRRVDTLLSPTWIAGSAGSGFRRARISLLGTGIFADADSTGAFLLGPLPGGELRLRLVADSIRQDAVVHSDPGQILSTGAWLSARWGEESALLWPSARSAVLDFSATGGSVVGNHAGFVVPVLLDSVLGTGSADPRGIRFDDGKGRAYPYQLARDAASGKTTAWVRLDTAHGNSSKHFLRLLWGRDVPPPSDMPALFPRSDRFLGAWHLDSDGETSGGTGLRWTGSEAVDGVVGGARRIAGAGNWTTDSVLLGGRTSWTVSFWLRLDAKPSGEALLAGVDDGPDSTRWGISVRDDRHLRVWSRTGTSDEIVTSAPLPLSGWTHVAATFDAASSRIGLVVDTTVYDRNTVAFPVAAKRAVHGGAGLWATFDEIRLSDTARDVHWSQLERQTQAKGGVPWIRW